MSASARRLLVRIGGWPRRIAALLCLLLAAGTAMVSNTPKNPAADPPHGVSAQLRTGEVAVPVPIGSSAGMRDVQKGEFVGVLAQPADGGAAPAALVADHLRVVSVHADTSGLGEASAVVVVATDRSHALALARHLAQPLLLMIDHYP